MYQKPIGNTTLNGGDCVSLKIGNKAHFTTSTHNFIGGFLAKCNKKKKKFNWVPVAHTYNFSYLGGRDQEDHSLSPAWANTS
jgi:hypothetical protein